MSDLETRLAAALSDGVEDAPDVSGLAAGARSRRHERRRARRIGGAALVLVVVVVVAGAGIGAAVVRGSSSRSQVAAPASRVVGTAADGWQTLSHGDLEVDIPPGWVSQDRSACGYDVEHYGPSGLDPCQDDVGLWFYGSATFDPFSGPGVHAVPASPSRPHGGWSGYVDAQPEVVDVAGASRAETTRILGSVRSSTTPSYLATQTNQVTWHGLTVTVPATWTSLSAPCVRGAALGDPTIETPADGSASSCTFVSQGYGARFFDASLFDPSRDYESGQVHRAAAGSGYPAGAWVGQVTVIATKGLDPGVFVVARDRATVERSLASLRFHGRRVQT